MVYLCSCVIEDFQLKGYVSGVKLEEWEKDKTKARGVWSSVVECIVMEYGLTYETCHVTIMKSYVFWGWCLIYHKIQERTTYDKLF